MTGERESLEDVLRFLRLGEEVVFLGQMPQQALPGIYRSALALVFPSHYEGFGYPPLEAMVCGVPPIVSDAAALPEVVGDAGLIVPRGDKGALRNAMLRILREPGLRDALAEKSKERARFFTGKNSPPKRTAPTATPFCVRPGRFPPRHPSPGREASGADMRVAIVHDWLTGMRGGENASRCFARYTRRRIFSRCSPAGFGF